MKKIFGALSYWVLVLVAVFFIWAAGDLALGLVRLAQGQETEAPVVVAPKLSEKSENAELDRIVEQLRRVYEFCKMQACTVIPRSHYEAIQRDMDQLREQLLEIEKQPRPSQGGCA